MLTYFIYLILKLRGDDVMMAMMFATRVILGKTQFNEVPAKLQPAVYDILLENGVEYLTGDYKPPAKPIIQ